MPAEPAGRRNGKTTAMLDAIREAAGQGEHVHLAARSGPRCVNGPAGCTTPRRTIAQLERELKRWQAIPPHAPDDPGPPPSLAAIQPGRPRPPSDDTALRP